MEVLHMAVIFFGLLGSAFYSGLETGIVSINRLRLEHLLRRGDRRAVLLHDFIEQPDHLLGTTLVGNNICNVITSVAAIGLGTHLADTAGYWVAYVLTTVTMLVAGEYLPKSWFQAAPIKRTRYFVGLLHINGKVFYPLSKVMTKIASILVPVRGEVESKKVFELSRDELMKITEQSGETGKLLPEKGNMINAVVNLSRVPCRDVMIPRSKMIILEDDDPVPAILEVAAAHNFTRLPVFREEAGRFIGIVELTDLIGFENDPERTAKDFMRAPQFAHGSAPVEQVLTRMRLSRQPLFLVTGEDGSVIGLVVLEDVLKVIFQKPEPDPA